MWPAKSKIFPRWSSAEKVCQHLADTLTPLDSRPGFHPACWQLYHSFFGISESMRFLLGSLPPGPLSLFSCDSCPLPPHTPCLCILTLATVNVRHSESPPPSIDCELGGRRCVCVSRAVMSWVVNSTEVSVA